MLCYTWNMGLKKGGRPKLSHWGMTQLYIRLGGYMKITYPKTESGKVKSELTMWNAFKKLIESKHWDGIVRQIYKRSSNKQLHINRLLNKEDDEEGRNQDYWCNKFYTNNVKRRGKDKLINYLSVKKTHRKKR